MKRYKYVGKERDEETGLYYYGARYYAAWLCRFVSVDALQQKYPELTSYQYASNNPITLLDIDGLEGTKKSTEKPRFIILPDNNPYSSSGHNPTAADRVFKQIPGSIKLAKVTKYKKREEPKKGIDPSLQKNAVLSPQENTAYYTDQKWYNERQAEQNYNSKLLELQATDNFTYGDPGQPVGSSGALGSVKAGYEAWGLVEGGYGLFKLGQFIKNYSAVKLFNDLGKVESSVNSSVEMADYALKGGPLTIGEGALSESSVAANEGTILRGVDDVITKPSLLEGKSLSEVQSVLKNTDGWVEGTLTKGRSTGKGWTFRKLNSSGTDFTGEYIQYSPGSPRHFGGKPYWKVSSGNGGTQWFQAVQ